MLRGVLEKDLRLTPRLAEIFFTCTTCGNCETHCPSGIETVKIFEIFRNDLQDNELGLPVHVALSKHALDNRNPYDEPEDQRFEFLRDVARENFDKFSELGYFVGCTSAYRTSEIARAFTRILVENDVDFTFLSDEYCCGSPLFRT
ncbi:MAG: heterodisulfide reductase-related iron-sulfur binding cluster, partial [Candidatus Helarchaeota archaeon]